MLILCLVDRRSLLQVRGGGGGGTNSMSYGKRSIEVNPKLFQSRDSVSSLQDGRSGAFQAATERSRMSCM